MVIFSVSGVVAMCGYGMVGLLLGPEGKVGGLRSEGEMYVCAVWFGIVSYLGLCGRRQKKRERAGES